MGLFGRSKRGTYQRLSLTAAAALLGEGGSATQITARRSSEQWQDRAFGYYDMLGECRNPTQFYARGLAKIRYYPARLDADGRPQEIYQGPYADLMRALSPLASEYGKLMFLVGEGRLCQSRAPKSDPGGPVVWEFLSANEVLVGDKTIERSADGGTQRIQYRDISNEPGGDPQPGEMRTWRFHRAHPRYSQQADSPVKSVLDLYEQLWWLTMGERADLQNRIADNGFMLIPSEISFQPVGAEQQATQEDPETDEFLSYVGETMMTAIGDPGSASAAVPGVIRGPAEYLHPDRFRMLHTHDPQSSLIASQREQQLIERIAVGLDLPVEEIVGMSKANHWTAWKIEDQKWQHLEPYAQGFANDVMQAVVGPLLGANGEQGEVVVMYDNSEFTRDPDRADKAIDLHVKGVISRQAVREVNGWPDDAAMSDEEHDEWLAIQLRSSEMIGAEPAGDTDTETPPAEDQQDAEPDEMRARAVEYATRRARATAGALLRSARRSCPECLEGTADLRPDQLLTALKPDTMQRMVPFPKLMEAMVDTFAGTLAQLGWVADHRETLSWFSTWWRQPDVWPGADEVTVARAVRG